MDNFKPLQAQPFLLGGSGAIIGDTTLTLQTFTQIDGTLITMSNLGSVSFMTLEPGNGNNEEQICFTGVTQNTNGTATLTGVKTVLFAYPYTQTSGLAKTHAGATTAILSNTSGFYNQFVAKDDDGTISEVLTFTQPNFPQMDGVTTPPSLPAQLVTKSYADSLTFAGAPNASTSVKGIVQIATQAQVDTKTLIGSTSAVLVQPLNTQRSTLLSDYVLDTSPSPNVILISPSPAISAYTAGQQFSFLVANTNTSPTVTLNVNGLGAKNIVKLNGSTSPATGDINVGQMIIVEYDGTNFQMLNPVANIPATPASVSSVIKFGGNGSDGALNISSGTTIINLASASVVTKNYSSISITGTGNLSFSNPSSTGTIVILKSQGATTITTSSSAAIDMRNVGATPGNNPSAALQPYNSTAQYYGSGSNLITGGSPFVSTQFYYAPGQTQLYPKQTIFISPGAPGGTNSGVGGKGGGALYMECGGAFNFTTGAINASGSAGGSTTSSGGAGGGGAGGMVVILYNSLTANTGTINTAGGAGGNATTGSGTSNGAGGGGSLYSAGGAGGSGNSNGTAAGGNSAGGGGAGTSIGNSATGGAGGSSAGGIVSQNVDYA